MSAGWGTKPPKEPAGLAPGRTSRKAEGSGLLAAAFREVQEKTGEHKGDLLLP